MMMMMMMTQPPPEKGYDMVWIHTTVLRNTELWVRGGQECIIYDVRYGLR